jgi:hypothetical protein
MERLKISSIPQRRLQDQIDLIQPVLLGGLEDLPDQFHSSFDDSFHPSKPE